MTNLFPDAFFVTGTDTGVGKTLISAILCEGLRASYWKPVQSGILEQTDTEFVRAMTSLSAAQFHPETYKLTQPLSPHASAKIDGIQIDMSKFVLPQTRPLLVEGAGGLMVPLNDQALIIDLIEQLRLPVVVVARSGLGTINHTTLTVDKLRSRKIPIVGVIMNGEKNSSNREAIEMYAGVPVIAELQPLPEVTRESIAGAFHHMLPSVVSA